MTLEEKERIFLKEIDSEEIRFEEMFGNSNPVNIEIGSGRGEFLIEIARLEPEANFLALELKAKRIKTILKRLDVEEHDNVRLMMVKVDVEMMKRIGAESVDRFYIFHPDPWPKRRHQKHRLIQDELIEELQRVLKSGSDVTITTDHEGYMKWIVKKFQDNPGFGAEYPEGFSREPFTNHIETHFEAKLKKKGFPPYYMRFIKR